MLLSFIFKISDFIEVRHELKGKSEEFPIVRHMLNPTDEIKNILLEGASPIPLGDLSIKELCKIFTYGALPPDLENKIIK